MQLFITILAITNRQLLTVTSDALADYSHIIELQNDNADAYLGRAVIYGRLNQNELAINDYLQAIALNVRSGAIYSNLALEWQKTGDLAKALQNLNTAIEITPDLTACYINRASVFVNLRDYQSALKDYDHAIANLPPNADLYYSRGIAHWKLDQAGNAEQDFSRAIELSPSKKNYFIARGDARFRLQSYREAIQDYQMAIKLKPQDATGYRALAWTHATCIDPSFRDGRTAIELAKTACQHRPQDAYCLLVLATAYAEAGDFQQAMESEQESQRLAIAKNIEEFPPSKVEQFKGRQPYRDDPSQRSSNAR